MSDTLRKLAPEIAAKVAEVTDLRTQENEFVLSQLGKLTEETGEAFGSYLRANGFARRRGTWDEHYEELADVVITAYVIAAAEEFDLDAAIEKKLTSVMTRGWKDGEVLADRGSVPVELLQAQQQYENAKRVEETMTLAGHPVPGFAERYKPSWWVEGDED